MKYNRVRNGEYVSADGVFRVKNNGHRNRPCWNIYWILLGDSLHKYPYDFVNLSSAKQFLEDFHYGKIHELGESE